MSTRQRAWRHQSTGFHQRLKQATETAHRRLEARLPLLDNGLTITEYRRLLRIFFGFYVPLESTLDACQVPALRADLACRRKSWWLLEDLLSLGETHSAIGALPLCQDMPPITCQADMLGALYVVEGATLGGQVILNSLRRSLGASADQHVRFFTSYGPHVSQMWAAFLRILEAGAYNPIQERMIMESACRTFTSFEQWLTFNHIHSQAFAVYDGPHVLRTSDMVVLHDTGPQHP